MLGRKTRNQEGWSRLANLPYLLKIPEEGSSPERYERLRRNLLILMLTITVIPLVLMAAINYYQYQSRLKEEILTPMRVLVNKTRHSFELFLNGRLSIVSFIASAYSYEDLADEVKLRRIFHVIKSEFKGFVDLGLIDSNGHQVTYVGPYSLKGKKYAQQAWFQQVTVSGSYISDVFKGYRRFPHVVIAVQHHSPADGRWWIVRATIDTAKFDDLIAAMGLEPSADAFLINREGVLQTNSRYYGQALDQWERPVPPRSHEPNIIEWTDSRGRHVYVVYSYFLRGDFILAIVKPQAGVLGAWYALKKEFLIVFVVGVFVIVAVVFRLTSRLVLRLSESDQKRELAFREMQHAHKLSSIGRLAAGVAHEINNPLSVINEKIGLMKDLYEFRPDLPNIRDVFLNNLSAVQNAVTRCSSITHRLLGFARRMDVEIEELDVNEVLEEVVGLLEREAKFRSIHLEKGLSQDLRRISSDKGQLQQVFLNLLNNAFAAVDDGGTISVQTSNGHFGTVVVAVSDNGCGMSEPTMRQVFEPFFTTKKGQGTGLGLSITHGIVKRLGGDIQVKSEVDKGTTFTIYLPESPPEKGESEDGYGRLESSSRGR